MPTSTPNKTISLFHGAQDKYNSLHFINKEAQQAKHQEIHSDYTRIWVSYSENGWSFIESIPLRPDCVTYNYTNLTKQITAVLKLGITPIISYRYAPHCMSIGGIASGESPPNNFNTYASYTANITNHFYEDCLLDNDIDWTNATGSYSVSCGNFSNWLFTPWNEPYSEIWHSTSNYNYTKLFDAVYREIKQTSPTAKVGASDGIDRVNPSITNFLDNATYDPDFISIHQYSRLGYADQTTSNYNGSDLANMLLDTKTRYYINPNNFHQEAISHNKSIFLINTEYNADYVYGPATRYIKTYVGHTWLSSALVWQALSNLTAEITFEGTDSQFGLWTTTTFINYPAAYAKKWFAEIFPRGKDYFIAQDGDTFLEVAYVKDGSIAINKDNRTISVSFVIDNSDVTFIKTHNESIPVTNLRANFTLHPYETKYFRHSCAYAGVGAFRVNLSDACVPTKNINMNRNSLSIFSPGSIRLNGSIKNYSDLYIGGGANVYI